MFNINQFNKVAGANQSVDIKSTTLNDIFLAVEAEGKDYQGFRFENRTFHPGKADERTSLKLVFGTFGDDNHQIKGTDSLEFNIGSNSKPLVLDGETDDERLADIMDNSYPVYYGVSTFEDEGTNDLGEKVTMKRVVPWLTINKAGALPESKPATAFDISKMISGKHITSAVASTGVEAPF